MMTSNPVFDLLLLLLLLLLCASSQLVESSQTLDILFRATGSNNVIFTDDLLFQTHARSVLDCGRQCASSDCCVTFSFNKWALSGICRGHSGKNMTLEDGHTFSPGTEVFAIMDRLESVSLPSSCAEAIKKGRVCGVQDLTVGNNVITAYCDMEWTVFQRRIDGSVEFYRGWEDYKNGFGSASGEFWMGLEPLHLMTLPIWYELRVDLEDWEGNTASATYSNFYVSSVLSGYFLNYNNFLGGNAGDSLGQHRFMPFSTMDMDNDQSVNTSCAQHFKAAWWFNDCYDSSLNGQYKFNSSTPDGEGLHWNSWKFDSFYSLKSSQMKIRPMP